jgi:hypothetical protein
MLLRPCLRPDLLRLVVVLLMVPDWPSQSWFAPLVQLASHTIPVSIDPRDVMLTHAAKRTCALPEILREANRASRMLLISIPAGRRPLASP